MLPLTLQQGCAVLLMPTPSHCSHSDTVAAAGLTNHLCIELLYIE